METDEEKSFKEKVFWSSFLEVGDAGTTSRSSLTAKVIVSPALQEEGEGAFVEGEEEFFVFFSSSCCSTCSCFF